MSDFPPRFEDRLLEALLSEHAALTATAYGDASVPRAVRRRSRHYAALPLSAGALAAGAAAAVLVWMPSPATTSRPAPSAAVSGPLPGHENAAYVVARMLTATEEDDAVVEDIEHAPNSQTGTPTFTEDWSQRDNPTSLDVSLDAAGDPRFATLLTRGPSAIVSTTIDYATRTYSTRTYAPDAPGGPAAAPATLSRNSSQLRAAVADHQATVAGSSTVDGQNTLEIIVRNEYGTSLIYVDPASYLTVREVDIPIGGSVSGTSTITVDSRYLPDTAGNLTKLTPAGAIPPGFHKTR